MQPHEFPRVSDLRQVEPEFIDTGSSESSGIGYTSCAVLQVEGLIPCGVFKRLLPSTLTFSVSPSWIFFIPLDKGTQAQV